MVCLGKLLCIEFSIITTNENKCYKNNYFS